MFNIRFRISTGILVVVISLDPEEAFGRIIPFYCLLAAQVTLFISPANEAESALLVSSSFPFNSSSYQISRPLTSLASILLSNAQVTIERQLNAVRGGGNALTVVNSLSTIKKLFQSAKAVVKRKSIHDSAISIPILLEKDFDDLITCKEGSSFDESDGTCTGEVLDFVTSILENLPNALDNAVPGVEAFEERIERWLHGVIETGHMVREEDVWKDAPDEAWEAFYEERFMERPEKGPDGERNYLLEEFHYLLSNPNPKIAGIHPSFLDKDVFDTEKFRTSLSYRYEPTKEEMDIFLCNVDGEKNVVRGLFQPALKKTEQECTDEGYLRDIGAIHATLTRW
ncbi:hypothetical protein EYC84_000262 [Monilinia fructicola]|uniref:Uncharacterized protein n=1 Tax=Monilinia fructicola TaxID=38448 RepID=A0A5M9JR32_MONFR|nr:hypothetical protein EYC84_000262 [Monilinia fructicola]